MFALGAGGLDVALVMAGEPFWITMPEVWGIHLKGELPDWVSAKDVILELLRRHGVAGGRGKILEFYGPGATQLSVMDRHVIRNMGVEMGALTSLFPSDDITRAYLESQGRGKAWTRIEAGRNPDYAQRDEVDLSQLEPLIAKPSSPDNVVPVHSLAGAEIFQSYIGSSANPGYRDAAIVARMAAERRLAAGVSLDVNPASRQALEQLVAEGHMASLVKAGARIHQTGCNGCVGMGQAPATGRRSLRTVPRNFPGRSGTLDDEVLAVQSGDGSGLCADRHDHRSAHARHGLSQNCRARGGRHVRRVDRAAASTREPAIPTQERAGARAAARP
jgi:aconitate hydratase